MMTVIFITCVMARGKDGAFASNWVATRIIFVPSRSFSSAWGFFYLAEINISAKLDLLIAYLFRAK